MTISFTRLYALMRKEWIQLTRDPITLRFIVALPLMQLFLFGYAINTNPKNLPTGLLSVDHSKYERTIVTALRNSGYYESEPLLARPRRSARLPRASCCSLSPSRRILTAPSIAESGPRC